MTSKYARQGRFIGKPRKGDHVTIDSETGGTIATVSKGVAYVDIGHRGSRIPVLISELGIAEFSIDHKFTWELR